MLEVTIGFKNGDTLGFHAEEFEVKRDSFGNKSYVWDTSTCPTKLLAVDANEVLWVTTKEALE